MNKVSYINVSFESVQRCDTRRTVEGIATTDQLLDERARNSLMISLDGYGTDPRELPEIPEARRFIRKLWDDVPALPYLIDIENGGFFFLGMMLYPAHRVSGGMTMLERDVLDYARETLARLHTYCNRTGRDPGPTEAALDRWIRQHQVPTGGQ